VLHSGRCADPDELLWPLAHGAELVLAHGRDAVLAELAGGAVHTLRTAPGLLHEVLAAPGAGPEQVLCAGEPLGGALEQRCLRAWPRTVLWTVYRRPGAGDIARRRCAGDAPSGRDIAGSVVPGVAVRVLDPAGRPQPIGVPGTVHVLDPAGPGDPLTSGAPATAVADTGDLGRFCESGMLEILGPVRDQVHQRQVRVPRGEIEAVLTDHDAVVDARVDARVDPADGELRVVAFVVPDMSAPVTSAARLAESLRAHCQRLLPGMLVPARFVALPEFALADDGTVDRSALSVPAAEGELGEAAVDRTDPHGPVETAIAAIWRSALGVPAIGVHQNFFALGGHSLLAVQVMTQIRRSLGVDLPVSVLFRYRTVADLAARIATLGSAGHDEGRALVPIQTGPVRPGLALVHPAGGSVFCYAALATALPSRTVQAFETRAPASSLAGQAGGYLAELDATDPDAYLGGWSLGGVVAFEMALRRVAAGADAAPVVLIDSFLFDGDVTSPDTHRYLLDAFLRDLLADLDLGTPALPPGAERLPARRLFADVLDGLGSRLPAGLDLEEVLARHEVYRRNMLNLAGYRPERAYPGEVHLVQASGSPEAADGWRPYAPRLVVHRVDGDHYSIMRNPRITRIARIVEEVLGSASSPGAGLRAGWAA
jgi:thioesterase domain-containing protein/acyl carrier protein